MKQTTKYSTQSTVKKETGKIRNTLSNMAVIAVLVFLAGVTITLLSNRGQEFQTGQGPDADHKVYLPIITKGDDVQQPNPTPDSDPTADWLTYQNDQFGYLIKYPASLTFTQSKNDVGQIPNTVFYYEKYREDYYAPLIGIDTYSNTEALTLEQWFDKRQVAGKGGAEFQQIEGKQLSMRQFGVNTQVSSFSYIKDLKPLPLKIHSRVFQKGDKVFEVYYSQSELYKDENMEPIYLLMLETLEFTK